jgi:hypothetical protein
MHPSTEMKPGPSGSSFKRQATSNKQQATSDKRQASSSEASRKHQATSCDILSQDKMLKRQASSMRQSVQCKKNL